MSDNPFAWTTDWLGFQRNYLEALNAFYPKSEASNPESSEHSTGTNPWTEALDHWWKTMTPTATPQIQDFYSRLIDQGKAYFYLVENMSNTFQGAAAATKSASEWQEAMTKGLESMKSAFTAPAVEAQDAARKLMGLWELPLDNWQRMVSSMSIMPGDFLQDLNTVGLDQMKQSVQGHLDQFLSVPGVGQMRERQDQTQELTRLWLNYQNALQDYALVYSELGVKSVERLQRSFGKLEREDQALNNLRDVYDLWVDCCETVYSDFVNTEDYAKAHGQLVNALMALKHHSRIMIDEVLGALNMPTRRELETIHSRFQLLRRESVDLKTELSTLREQLKQQTSRAKTVAPKPRPRTKRATKRTAATKEAP